MMKKLLNVRIPYTFETAIRLEKLLRHSSYIKEFQFPLVAGEPPYAFYSIGPLNKEGVDRWIAQFAETLKDNPNAEKAEFNLVDVVEKI